MEEKKVQNATKLQIFFTKTNGFFLFLRYVSPLIFSSLDSLLRSLLRCCSRVLQPTFIGPILLVGSDGIKI